MNKDLSDRKPILHNYKSIALFIKDQILYLKKTVPRYSVHRQCLGLRKISPTLVSLICPAFLLIRLLTQ